MNHGTQRMNHSSTKEKHTIRTTPPSSTFFSPSIAHLTKSMSSTTMEVDGAPASGEKVAVHPVREAQQAA